MYIYMPHIKLVASTKQQRALYTYLAYIPEQIKLPHFKYSSHVHYAKWAYGPSIFTYISQTQPAVTSASSVIAKYVPKTNMPTKLGAYAIYVKYLMCIYGGCMCIYVLPYIKTMTCASGTYTHTHNR